jgi:regulator of protease activity HflC (stomatin/prohibitin superfamily)
MIILLSISMTTLETGRYGLKFSHYSQDVVGEPITEPGIKWVGALNSLILFPSVYQLVYFDDANAEVAENEVALDSVHSRTYDGLQIYVKISFQWYLKPENLKGVYAVLGGAEDLIDGEVYDNKPSFIGSIIRIARGALTAVCSQYTAADFFANQTVVQERMFQALQDTFSMPEENFVINVAGLQVRNVDLPDAYENSIADTQQAQQDFRTATAERFTKEVELSTAQVKSREKQTQLKVEVNAKKIAILAENAAVVEQYMKFQVMQADGYAKLLKVLIDTNATNPYETLLGLMRQRALKSHDINKLILTM